MQIHKKHPSERVQSFDESEKYQQLTLQDAPIIAPTANELAIAEFERLINECKALDLEISSQENRND
jgi:hypothetical protein